MDKYKKVAGALIVSTLASLAFVVVYFLIDTENQVSLGFLGTLNTGTLFSGLLVGIAFLSAGAGIIWLVETMNLKEESEERHEYHSDPEEIEAGRESMKKSVKDLNLTRRRFVISIFSISFLTLFVSLLAPVRSLFSGSFKKSSPGKNLWKRGVKLVTSSSHQELLLSEIEYGTLTFVEPQGLKDDSGLASSSALVVRIPAKELTEKTRSHSIDGVVAYSKICTHVGCPVGLYQRERREVLCLCHQSTFDLKDMGKVVFGPASRPLPILPLRVNESGALEASDRMIGYTGPSCWKCKRDYEKE
jgi:ubiquinol-cytochrome c reductase iron-sulfur subunit